MIPPKQRSFWHRAVLYPSSCTCPPIRSAGWKESATNQPLGDISVSLPYLPSLPLRRTTRPRLPPRDTPPPRDPAVPAATTASTACCRFSRAPRAPSSAAPTIEEVLLPGRPLRRAQYLAASSRRRPAPAAAATRGAAAGAGGARRRGRNFVLPRSRGRAGRPGRRSPPVPPFPSSLKLYKEVLDLGFKAILLTGRSEGHRGVTVDNLNKQGFHDWDKLILGTAADRKKTATTYKSEKRKQIEAEGYMILGNSGDQWSDLLGSSVSARSFKLPNPMYYIP